jgi:hypothetical protein
MGELGIMRSFTHFVLSQLVHLRVSKSRRIHGRKCNIHGVKENVEKLHLEGKESLVVQDIDGGQH